MKRLNMLESSVVKAGVVLFIGAAALAGCQTAGTSLTGAAGKPLIDSVKAVPASSAVVPASHTPTEALLTQRSASVGVARVQAAEQYLNGLLQKIIDVWPGTKVPARVYITPDFSFDGRSTKDGAIFVTTGMLASIESEDEAVALLGHEYTHVALGHHDKSSVEDVQKTVYGLAKIGMGFYAGVKGASENDLLRQTLLNEGVLEAGMTALLPLWSRAQEEEADKVGLDLLLKLKYSDVGMADLLQRIGVWEKEMEERNRRVVKTAEELVKVSDPNSTTIPTITFDWNAIFKEAAAAASEIGAKLRRQHADAEVRLEDLSEYKAAAYPDIDRPAKRTAPYKAMLNKSQVAAFIVDMRKVDKVDEALAAGDVKRAAALATGVLHGAGRDIPRVQLTAYGVLRTAGQSKAADALMDKMLSASDVLLQAYVQDAKNRLASSPHRALARLEEADKLFNSPPQLLPDMVHFAYASGDKTKAAALKLKCTSTGSRDLAAQCDKIKG
jgi:beta-barrel assembly-enhancing protease